MNIEQVITTYTNHYGRQWYSRSCGLFPGGYEVSGD